MDDQSSASTFILHTTNACICSDSSVGVEHHTEGRSHGVCGQVLDEVSLNEAGVAVVAGDLAPHGLEVGSAFLVLASVNEGDALSVIEVR